ncbi:MAG TPA: beta-ketoacyl-[acyl-carrier-protein] synthase family protein, partial [Planctomycetaceae bacterium]|nr:beta-ketoacyl-[acyl-carrier-protein] synthase family protein [Planctomycetaceae bacterium]
TAAEALADAGLQTPPARPDRVGCVLGTGKGGLQSFTRLWHDLRNERGLGETTTRDPTEWFYCWPNAAAAVVSHVFGLRAVAVCPVAACATGLASVAYAADLIREGRCDVVLAGSADASLHPSLLAAYRRLGVLARAFEEPSRAVRPFDRNRNGFLVGEGAGMLVLERWEHAQQRGATPYAEWVGWAGATDVHGLIALDANGTALAQLLQRLLEQTQLSWDEVDYINLHGTATRLNDLCETRAVKAAFGRHAPHLSCSGLKGALGHLLGAAGSVELAATALAIRDRIIPPTVNLFEPDDLCDLDYTAGTARSRRIENAIKISLGFGEGLGVEACTEPGRS